MLKSYIKYLSIVFFISAVIGNDLEAQPLLVDQIVAVVGQNMILESTLEAEYLRYRSQGTIEGTAKETKCQILEGLLYEKLLLNQAELDSVEITESQVEQNMDQRLRYFISQFGSQEKLEEFYDKSILEIKNEFREQVRDQLMVESVQNEITMGVSVTPNEVKTFFKKIPRDSIPLINSEVQIGQIVKYPPITMEQKIEVKERLRELRKRIIEGESFATLAILYSEDPGSASKGGELGFYGRGELFPEFETVAFRLSEGETSDIVETEAGFHIIQMIERQGEYVNVRHILLTVKVSPIELAKARAELDSLAVRIRNDEISFEEAVREYSDDPGKYTGGMLINMMTGTTTFEMDELDPQVSFAIDKLEVNELSNAVPMKTEEGKDAYRILLLKQRTKPHRANLDEDYSKIQEWAMEEKRIRVMSDWVDNRTKNAYIKIDDKYLDCDFRNKWYHDDK